MELYFNNNLSDITYLSELIPVALLRFAKQSEAAGINSQTQATGKKEAAIIYVAPSELP